MELIVWRETSIAAASCCCESWRAVRRARTSLRIQMESVLDYVESELVTESMSSVLSIWRDAGGRRRVAGEVGRRAQPRRSVRDGAAAAARQQAVRGPRRRRGRAQATKLRPAAGDEASRRRASGWWWQAVSVSQARFGRYAAEALGASRGAPHGAPRGVRATAAGGPTARPMRRSHAGAPPRLARARAPRRRRPARRGAACPG